jgi:hypothetical protein
MVAPIVTKFYVLAAAQATNQISKVFIVGCSCYRHVLGDDLCSFDAATE